MSESDWNEDSDDDWDASFDDDEAEVLPCRECGADVYEDAEQCPVCHAYLTRSTSAWLGRPAWWVVLGFLGVVATILMLAWF